ncbi:hypothetical protein E2562_034383 [Oryza meyeriana var. granulata]|uniref:Cyclin N-terminal domain-containing protein n=1 Tax=Oryza meyeriana var. granulata TaxID=110450 RepID=A0A6G1CKV3_9ORYZ|nr:hypothetical protein E2562_034383 [Oryza meyeriana var. granulata]
MVDLIMDPYMEDAIMDPHLAELLADDTTLPMFGYFYGGGALEMDSYLRAIGALPPLAQPPESPRTPDAYGGGVLLLPEYGDHPVPPEESKPVPVGVDHPVQRKETIEGEADQPVVTKNSTTRPQLCEPYDDDVEATLLAMEKNPEERPSPYFLEMTQGGQMTVEVRASIISFMDGFSRWYKLAAGTVHRAAYYLDRYLSVTPESNDYLQLRLVGATAVFLAAKYDDQYTLRKLNASKVAAYCGYTTDAKNKMVLCMEIEILTALDYNLSGPTAYTFQDQLVKRAAHILAGASLYYYGFHRYLPSVVAASAIFLARLHFLAQPWSKDLAELTGYKAIELMGCVCDMYSFMPNPRFALFQEYFFEDL